MKIGVLINRTAKWLRQQMIDLGENVPESILVDVEVKELSLDARELLLKSGDGKYPDRLISLRFGSDGVVSAYGGYGQEKLFIDGNDPSAEQINSAIMSAYSVIQSKAAEIRRQKAEVRDAEEKKRQEALALEAAKNNARTVLRDEISQMESEITQFKEALELYTSVLSNIKDDDLQSPIAVVANGMKLTPRVVAGLLDDACPFGPGIVIGDTSRFSDEDDE